MHIPAHSNVDGGKSSFCYKELQNKAVHINWFLETNFFFYGIVFGSLNQNFSCRHRLTRMDDTITQLLKSS